MTNARLTPMTMLLVAAIATVAGTQEPAVPTPAAPTDSMVKDTTKKKPGRFGSIVKKAKTVAGNKAVQGAAKGVACTVVPGAAVSAAAGTGPCAGSGVVGSLMSGGVKAAAATAAGEATATGTAHLAAKGGIVGAAAGGVLGAMGGVTGLSHSAAHAAALKIMTSSKATGLSNAASQAAALKLMQQNGMSNANAAAALAQMMKSPPPAASAADAAVAMQMLQAMGLMAGTASSVSTAAASSGVAGSSKSPDEELAATGRVVIKGLVFEAGSDKLRPESAPALRAIASMMETHSQARFRLEGHTDNVGSAAANRTLSEKRAAAVKAALVTDYKVYGGRLEAKGFGDTKPAGSNATAEGRAHNMRVELVKM